MASKRTPFPRPLPIGWFGLARTDEFTEAVTTVEAFGREVVVWFDGEHHHAVDSVCPHLGAHLGVGGRVEEGCLVCPFHEWSFGADGTNVAIPYADRPNRKARLGTYPTMVRNGLLLAWYHPDRDVTPTFEVPQRITDDMVEVGRLDRVVPTVWQEIAENSVDMAHFKSVHGTGQVSPIGEMTMDGPFRTVRSEQVFRSARGDFPGTIESNSCGPGVGIVHFDLMGRVTQVSSTTPIDDESCRVRFTFYTDGSEIAGKIAPGFAAEVERQFDQDIPIWAHKTFLTVPALAPSEKPIMEFRKWADQFYAS
ncbi:Rieske 2Fe-2S domain-containing protein [Rhabdothermincola salaria]|uniref:Rieske 2Fe-2S domain-containing protein n=1 Tax=Rhabdothermincola salaria TaxID=2903142 RepID=UPI001E627B74|nr:Rieske 2Fe-2S domain-containing protein [Rhabdothermincola salaria]